MKRRILAILLTLLISGAALPCALAQQSQNQTETKEPVIKIGTDLIQIDAVVLDKNGKVVRGLTKNDFELSENGKRQQISFFEFVDAGKGIRISREATGEAEAGKTPAISTQGPGEADIHRIFSFVVDDLTIRPADLTFVRQMLTNFVDNRMEPTDLVGIVRTAGGADLLQQFTSDKDILHRAISLLMPRTSAFNIFNQNGVDGTGSIDQAVNEQLGAQSQRTVSTTGLAGNTIDIDNPNDETNATIRAYMTLGTASFVIDEMKQLPGRKTMVLVSGGIQALGPGGGAPIVGGQAVETNQLGLSVPQALTGPVGANANFWLDQLADKATRAGVAINTMDIRGLSGQTGVANFVDTPGKSAMGAGTSNVGFGRTADESMVGNRNPYDVTTAHMGLRELSAATGGIAVLNRNDFDKGLGQIVGASDGYYLLAYTPSDSNFKGDFRKWEIKVKGGYKVLSRKGYFAKAEEKLEGPKTTEQQILEAIQSPVAKRDLGLDMMVLYKAAAASDKGAIDVELNIDPARLTIADANGKKEAKVDVAGFIYDQFGRMKGGFSKTLDISLTPAELQKAYKDGVPFPTQSTELKPGSYEIRIGARDPNTGALGTISRYIEVPDLAKGHLSASTLLLGAVSAGETKAGTPTPISGNRRITRDKDLRYAVIIYNAKRKDDHAKVTTQLTIMQDGKVLYREQPQEVTDHGKDAMLLKVGQLGLSSVRPGRYLLQLEITDQLGDKKTHTIYRSMDFAVE